MTGWDALAAWPGAILGEPLGGGTVNDVREVRIGAGRYVGRLSRRSADDVDWEVALSHRLRPAGIGVPSFVPSADGREHVAGIVVMEWVDGEQPSTVDHLRLVAAHLRTLHAVTAGTTEQRPGWRSCADLATERSSGPVDLRTLPLEVVERLRVAWSRLQGKPRSIIHGDPNPTNIRVSGDQVVLLDWDEARVDVPLLDLAALPEAISGLSHEDYGIAADAAHAWEAALFWHSAPDYARRRFEQLRA